MGGAEGDFGAPPSVLLEEDPDDAQLSDEDAGQGQMTGVKRMAHAFDAIYSSTSASEASGDDAAPLRQQWTGEGQRRDGWKRWEAEMRPLRRQNTGSSIGSIDELSLVPTLPPAPTAPVVENVYESEEEAVDANVATIKARPAPGSEPMEAGPSSVSSSGASPPPPYASPNPGDDPASPCRPASSAIVPPAPTTPDTRSASHSATPTPTHHLDAHPPTSTSASPSPSVSRLAGRQSLGRSTSRRLPKPDDGGAETDDERDRVPTEHYSSARRVTIRPAKTTPRASSIFPSTTTPSGEVSPAKIKTKAKTQREMDLERQLADMGSRLKELETKLDSVLSDPSSTSSATANGHTLSSYLLGRLGLVSGDEGLPKSVGELPAYLFLVGFGVGAVVVRVLFTRK